jgi:hypothetical protein
VAASPLAGTFAAACRLDPGYAPFATRGSRRAGRIVLGAQLALQPLLPLGDAVPWRPVAPRNQAR